MAFIDIESEIRESASYLPATIAKDLANSPLNPVDLADAIRATRIVSCRLIEEVNEEITHAVHIVTPIETLDINGEIFQTPVSTLTQWLTLENAQGDVSYRITLAFQDSVALTMERKAIFECTNCHDQHEECEDIFDDGTETWSSYKFPQPSKKWWPESWLEDGTPRLFVDPVHEVASDNFAEIFSRELAEAIVKYGWDEMISEGDISPLKIAHDLWMEVAEVISPLPEDQWSLELYQ